MNRIIVPISQGKIKGRRIAPGAAEIIKPTLLRNETITTQSNDVVRKWKTLNYKSGQHIRRIDRVFYGRTGRGRNNHGCAMSTQQPLPTEEVMEHTVFSFRVQAAQSIIENDKIFLGVDGSRQCLIQISKMAKETSG